jgi:hypothetical protein
VSPACGAYALVGQDVEGRNCVTPFALRSQVCVEQRLHLALKLCPAMQIMIGIESGVIDVGL